MFPAGSSVFPLSELYLSREVSPFGRDTDEFLLLSCLGESLLLTRSCDAERRDLKDRSDLTEVRVSVRERGSPFFDFEGLFPIL